MSAICSGLDSKQFVLRWNFSSILRLCTLCSRISRLCGCNHRRVVGTALLSCDSNPGFECFRVRFVAFVGALEKFGQLRVVQSVDYGVEVEVIGVQGCEP